MVKLQNITMAIGIVIVSLFPLPLLAQSHTRNANEFDEIDKVRIAEHVREEIGMFTDYLVEISDKKIERKTRLHYKDVALKLFIGAGKDYQELILNNDGQVVDTLFCEAVTMGVTSLRNPKLRKKRMADYLLGLAELRYSSNVSIQTVEYHDMRVSEVRKVGDDKYECIVYFEQVFISKGRDNIPGYSDRTKKKVTCYIDLVRTDEGVEIFPLLGNVTAVETHSVR